ncbi:VOC family protein [Actinomyces sp.]|nr:VOC family protein [Actinomyces sp.]MDO4901671.1 VOC family protein [Actinomyces sp.]
MRVTGIDHFVLTVGSIPAAVDFYTRILGLEVFTFDGGRVALRLGEWA